MLIAVILFAVMQQVLSASDLAVRDGNNAYELRQYDRALTAFDRAIQLDSKNVLAYRRRAAALASLRRYDDAVATCSNGMAANPGETTLLVDRGHYYLNLHRIDLALADLSRVEAMRTETVVVPLNARDRIMRLQVEDARLWFHLGFARYLNGQFAAAADTFDKCIRTTAGSVCYGWGYLALRRAGRDNEAKAFLGPTTIAPSLGRHRTDFLRSIIFTFWATSWELDPSQLPDDPLDRAAVAHNAGIWHLLNGNTDRARTFFQLATAAPSDPDAFGALAAEAELKRMPR
jgi:tetratricopeptide (TPR) repeat protein